MFLIDEPYASDFLIRTIKDHHFPLLSTAVARKMIPDTTLNWVGEEEAAARLKQETAPLLYSNSENALDWIAQHLSDTALARQIGVLKDKVQFRQLTRDLFPELTFREVPLADLQHLAAEELTFPFVIKPSVGFFSIGVHVVHDAQDWLRVKSELRPERLRSIFPATVLDTSTFVLETLIPGEEFAVDYYHDAEGKVVLLNVLHHVFSSGTDTSDRVYTTSKAIITQHRSELEAFLSTVGEKLQLRNFPAHAEVRIAADGQIRPIEINPLRFGGWCTTADLMGLTLGLNTYECLMHQRQPDWEEVFRGRADKLFSIIVLDNRSGIDPAAIARFDYDKLARDFEHPVAIRAFDIQQYPTFGFVFAETSPANAQELQQILTSDLKQYIELQSGS